MTTPDPFRAAVIPAMRAALVVLDDEIARLELCDCDDDEVREMADAADRLREVLRSAGEAA